jgi:diguanylate cyclase (GGDEF)-like protein
VTVDAGLDATEQDWDRARRRTVTTARLTAALGAIGIPILGWPATLLAQASASGRWRYLAVVAWLAMLCLPLVLGIWRLNDRQMRRSNRTLRQAGGELRRLLDVAKEDSARQAALGRRQDLETRLANALEMADGEPEVLGVIERAFAVTVPDSPVELLLADNSHAHLVRMAGSSPTGELPGCPVDSPERCPAARRGQPQRFDDSDALDACPKLRDRSGGPVAAVCVPVSIMGRTVGVLHSTRAVGDRVSDSTVEGLSTLASLAGARLGMLRMVADVELQASTDSLTGLLNRRAFETQLTEQRKRNAVVAVAMADLDRFKALNDTYGHDTGDRALRLFAETLRASVRSGDLASRHGGEEFVVAFPGCAATDAARILETIRLGLREALAVAGLPQFTASFGVVELEAGEDLPMLLRRADAALFEAKRSGRDRVTVHRGAAGAPTPRCDEREAPPLAAPEPAALQNRVA